MSEVVKFTTREGEKERKVMVNILVLSKLFLEGKMIEIRSWPMYTN